ncbi:MAG: hypothetical protein ACPG30_05435 [Parvibaculales bacterium]
MADEDVEARRMSEIADAINTILQNDPSQAEAGPRAAAEPDTSDNNATSDNGDKNDAAGGDLDAAIAAEFVVETENIATEEASNDAIADTADETEALGAAGDDPFGPPVTLTTVGGKDTADIAPDTNAEKPPKDSDLSLLSLRMQETLADLQSGNDPSEGTRELLEDMKLLRAQVMADIRGEIENLTEAAQERQAMIQEELRQLEAQSQTVREAVEIQLAKFETVLDGLHQQYFKNAKAQRIRVDRYREFLQFLLKEREF